MTPQPLAFRKSRKASFFGAGRTSQRLAKRSRWFSAIALVWLSFKQFTVREQPPPGSFARPARVPRCQQHGGEMVTHCNGELAPQHSSVVHP